MSDRICGFPPFFDCDSEVLILGSFPSVKSRECAFYYGNPRNAFWRILSQYFQSPYPTTVEDKKELLRKNRIALWDIVAKCRIKGSQDSTICDCEVANLRELFTNCPIKAIIVNGGKAYSIFKSNYPDLEMPVFALPSTSPANTRRKDDEWFTALRKAFGST